MVEWERKEAEYKQHIAEWGRSIAELSRAFRGMDWWPELDNGRERLKETKAYRNFKGKLDGFADSGEMERLRASSFWDSHMPKEYSKPEWYAPVDASVFDAAVERRAHEKAAEAASGVQAPDPDALLARVRDGVVELRANLERRYDSIDEDSYVSRMEAREDLSFVYQFEHAIAHVKPGGEVDLRRVGVNYGYDPEEAYSDRSVGLEYVPAIERERSQFASDISRVQPFIDDLEKANVTVRRQFRELWHEDFEPRIFRSDQESLNRHLDLKEEAPALIGILLDVGARRLSTEERYERLHETGQDMREKLGNEIYFIARLQDAITEMRPGGIIDMRVAGLHIDDVQKAVAAELPKGLTYMVADEMNRAEYHNLLAGIEKYIRRLEEAGITVRTGYREILARDYAQGERVEQPVPARDQPDQDAKPRLTQSIATDSSSERRSVHDEATMYWSGIVQSATASTGPQQSESLVQTTPRGRGR